MRSGSQSLLSAVVIANSLSQALELEERFKALPSVASVSSMVKYLTENQARKLELLREIKIRVGDIRLPPADTNPVDIARLGRSLASLELYLGFGAGKIRSQGGDEKFVAELLGLRDAVASLQHVIGESGGLAGARLTKLQQGLLRDVQETVYIIQNQDATERLQTIAESGTLGMYIAAQEAL